MGQFISYSIASSLVTENVSPLASSFDDDLAINASLTGLSLPSVLEFSIFLTTS